MTEHVDLMVELSQLTCLIINDYIYDSVKNQIFMSNMKMAAMEKNIFTSKLWDLMKIK